MKMYLAILFSFFLLLSVVEAKDAALVVKDASALSDFHEKRVKNILTDLGFSVTLVDKNNANSTDFKSFDLVVIAGRPASVNSAEHLDSFVKSIPVNEVNTIAIDFPSIDDFGWIEPGGQSSVTTSTRQKILISSTHPILKDFALGSSLFVHTIDGKAMVDLISTKSHLLPVASLDSAKKFEVISVGPPNTPLAGNKSVSNSTSVIFFGITYPIYWTDEAVEIFKKVIDWMFTLDFQNPPTPILSGPSSSRTGDVTWNWTAVSDPTGIQHYQLQIATDSNFVSILKDEKVLTTSFTLKNLDDGKILYSRVRAFDWENRASDWSNVVKTNIDFSDIIIKIFSPTPSNMTFGQTVFVNATVTGQRLIDGDNCVVSIGSEFVANLTYSKTTKKCLGNVTIPSSLGFDAFGSSEFRVSMTNSFGTTNSSFVLVNFNRLLSVSVASSKASYSPGENVSVSGKVLVDNSFPVPLASITYILSNGQTGKLLTDMNGQFSLGFNNLTDGSYSLKLNIDFKNSFTNSTLQFTVATPPSAPSVSGGGGGGSIIFRKIVLTSPKSVDGFVGEDLKFNIKVENQGTVNEEKIRIQLAGLEFPFEVESVDYSGDISLDPDKSVDFIVIIHIPQNAEEKSYQFSLRALSTYTGDTETVNLNVARRLLPDVGLIEFQVPEQFVFNQTALVNVTVENNGEAEAEVTLTLFVPLNWTLLESSQTIVVAPGERETVSFEVIPGSERGEIKLVASYDKNGEIITLSETALAEVESPEPPFSITALLTLLSEPAVTFGAAATLAVAIALYAIKFKGIDLRKLVRFGRISRISPYERWENKFKRKLANG